MTLSMAVYALLGRERERINGGKKHRSWPLLSLHDAQCCTCLNSHADELAIESLQKSLVLFQYCFSCSFSSHHPSAFFKLVSLTPLHIQCNSSLRSTSPLDPSSLDLPTVRAILFC